MILRSTAQKSKCPRRFWEIRPWNFAHVCNVPLPSLRRMNVFFVFFFFRWKCAFRKTQIYKTIQKPKYLARENINKRNPFAKGSAGAHQIRVQISGSISKRRRGHWTLKKVGVSCLNQPLALETVTPIRIIVLSLCGNNNYCCLWSIMRSWLHEAWVMCVGIINPRLPGYNAPTCNP